MNIKSFSLGFTAMDSVIAGVSAAKRGIVHAAKSAAQGAKTSAQATKNGVVHAAKSAVQGAQTSAQAAKNAVLATSDAVTSFFAGASQAIKCRRGECRMLTHAVHSNE